MKNPGYYGHPRREMIPFVPDSAHTILDIGCGAGAFAAGLRVRAEQRGQKLDLWGVEMSPEAARLAGEVLGHIQCGGFLSVADNLPARYFDCVVLNDVLEHVPDPGLVLRRVQPLLAPGATVVASLPNVRYFFNVLNLAVFGRWDYTDEGILDRTHLRFFTRSSLLDLFGDNGYAVESVQGINPTGSLKFKLMNLLTLGRWSDMKYLQFAVVATARD